MATKSQKSESEIELARVEQQIKDLQLTKEAALKYFQSDEYINAQRESDEWVSRIKYLIQTLDNRDHAVQLAHYAGMPGYINMR